MQEIVAQMKKTCGLISLALLVLFFLPRKISIIVNRCRTDKHLKSEQAENKGFAHVKTWGSGVEL